MLNEELLAKRYFILARNGNRNIAEDSDAAEKGELYYDKKFSNLDKKIILSQNYLEAGNYNLVIETLNKITNKEIEHETLLKIDLLLIEAFQENNNYDAGELLLNKYKKYEEFSENSDYTKLLYLISLQAFHNNKIDKVSKFLEEAFDNINKNENKLNRLLINLHNRVNK